METWVWWALFALLILFIELVHFAWIVFWFAVGALAASFLAYFYPTQIVWQVETFFVVSILSLIFLRPLIPFLSEGVRFHSNVQRIVGREELCVEEIDDEKGTGAVRLYGSLWSARSKSGEKIKAGERVKIVGIEDVTLIVEPLKNKPRKEG